MQIYGKNVAREKLQTKDKIKKVYLSNKFKDNEIITLIKKKNINPILLDMRDLDKMCKGLHQGIILEVEDVKSIQLFYFNIYKKVFNVISSKFDLDINLSTLLKLED